MLTERYLGPFRARRKLLIPNGSGAVPSSIRVPAGALFSFDGDEPVDIEMLERQGAVERYTEPLPPDEPDEVKPKAKGRAKL